MRPIPPEIWGMAIQIGKLQSLLTEIPSPHGDAALAIMKEWIDSFLESTRKSYE